MNLDEIFMSVQNVDSFVKPNIFDKTQIKLILNAELWLQGAAGRRILKGIVTNPELFPNVCESLNKCDEFK